MGRTNSFIVRLGVSHLNF